MPTPVVGITTEEQLDEHHELMFAHIARALEYSHRPEDTLHDVLEAITEGRAAMVSIFLDGELRGTCVIDDCETTRGLYLNVWCLGGDEMHLWLGHLLEWLDESAKAMQRKGVMCGGRPGWQKQLSPFGWKCKSVIMVKDL